VVVVTGGSVVVVVVEVVVEVVVVVAGTTYSADLTRTMGLSMWNPASVNGPVQSGPTAML
jgi:hypothetical protein